MMLLPTELTLKTTKEGIRMFNGPVNEVNHCRKRNLHVKDLMRIKLLNFYKQFNDAVSIRIKTSIKLSHSTSAGLNLYGQTLFKYDMNYNQINGLFYSPEDRTSMEINVDIIIDKTSVEVFVDEGAFSYAIERKAVDGNKEGFKFFGKNIEVKSLKVYPMKSIWGSNL